MRRLNNAEWSVIPCHGLGMFGWKANQARPFLSDATGVVVDKDSVSRDIRLNLARIFPGAALERITLVTLQGEAAPQSRRDGNILKLQPSPDVPRYILRRE
ncbi:MAG: hypothetical protein FJ279_11640 [Planctomycetes bacterium]|nr:hypothetical protein [Planctomycetota bacterium]